MVTSLKIKTTFFGIILLAGWFVLHMPAVFYGTQDLPLHMSYIGDEQSPVNGALHILQDKNLLALRDLNTVYYGPIFSIIALPAVVADYAVKYFSHAISGANDYKNFILWDWGGIVVFARTISVIVGFLGLIGLYKLLSTKTFNPLGRQILPILGVAVLAMNFFYFEYASFFKHWIFISALLLWQLYYAVKIFEAEGNTTRYFVYEVIFASMSFGISYLGLVFQIMWLPLILHWWRVDDRTQLRRFSVFAGGTLLVMALIIAWHPHAFKRILGLTGGDISNTDTSALSTEVQATGFSFAYYGLILLKNNLPIIIASAALTLASRRRLFFKNITLWVVLLPLLSYAVIFGTFSHHESRYILPVIILLITTVFFSAGQFGEFLYTNRILRVTFSSLLVFYFVFNVAHIGKWLTIIKEGPEERAAIEKIIDLENETSVGKTLFIGGYLLGYIHTKDAYRDYADRSHKSELNLYRAIFAGTPPVGVHQLRTYYSRPDEPFPKEASSKYAHIVYRYEPKVEQKLGPDFMEVDLTRLWFYKDFTDKYNFLK